jgi:hypothetical protein
MPLAGGCPVRGAHRGAPPMLCLPVSLEELLLLFVPCFSHPTYRTFPTRALVMWQVSQTGLRTIAGARQRAPLGGLASRARTPLWRGLAVSRRWLVSGSPSNTAAPFPAPSGSGRLCGWSWRSRSVLSFSGSESAVEADLVAGRLACPRCSGALSPWGYARARDVRMLHGTDASRNGCFTERGWCARRASCLPRRAVAWGWLVSPSRLASV